MGNFALPAAQQPGPFISFGQNIIDQFQFQICTFTADYEGKKRRQADTFPALICGVTDRFSLLLSVPASINRKDQHDHSSGLLDTVLQLEYAFSNRSTEQFEDQGTVVVNISFPTGSPQKDPATGFGSAGFFVGGTWSRMYIDWYLFTSEGIQLTSSRHRTKFGNSFLYEFGLGRVICSRKNRWIVAWLVEMNGNYAQTDRIRGRRNPDSGGNTIFMTPSLWISNQSVAFQIGFGWPLLQHFFGNQKRYSYLAAADLAWIF